MTKHCNSSRWWLADEIRDRDLALEGGLVCRYKHPSELKHDQYGYHWTEVHGWGTCRHYRRAWLAMDAMRTLGHWDWLLGLCDSLWWGWVKYPRSLRREAKKGSCSDEKGQ